MAFRQVLLNVELIFIVIIILFTAKFTKSDTEVEYNNLNDTHLIPLHYDVKIKFDAYRNFFSGNCYIKILIFRPVKNITIASSEIFTTKLLRIDLINKDNNKIITISKYCFIDKTYILDFTQSSVNFLSPGTYFLKIKYESTIFDDEDSFRESFYTDEEEGKVLYNQSIIIMRARQLFPYVDKSVFKLHFNISIQHYKNYNILLNVPTKLYNKVDDLNNMLWTQLDTLSSRFAEDLIFVVTTMNYDFIEFPTIANVRFWRKKEITEQVRYAEMIIHKVVHYLIRNSPKKISQMNFFVIKDFQNSDVKIQEFILLSEEDVICNTLDHIARKMEVANLIARETISYWYDDIFMWSKDGFIAFLAAHILDQTELYHMDLFVVQTLQESLRFDTLPLSSHAYNSSSFVVHSFRSSLHYIKSFIIWRMLYNIISDNVFWIGINRYVNTQYNQTNATDNNLSIVSFWTAIESALNETTTNISDFNIKDFVDFWSLEGYHPLLYVTRNNFTNSTFIFSNFETLASLTGIKKYQIYFTYATRSDNETSKNWSILSQLLPYYTLFDNNDWIIVNLQQVGYYRVNYNLDNWRKLADYLYCVNYTHIPVSNRAQIIDDAFNFMTLRELDFYLFRNISNFLLKDTDYVAWYPMIKAIEYMTCIWAIQNSIIVKREIKYMLRILLLNIGYEGEYNESDFTKCLREEAVKWACVLDITECRKTATFQLEKHLASSGQDKLLNWKEWIYCKGLMTANVSTWYKVWNKWSETSNDTILEYLTCSTNTRIIQIYLVLIKQDNFYLKVSKDKVLRNKTIANMFLLIVAKHARNNEVLNYMFNHSELFDLSRNRQVDEIAVLIVIITHEHDVIQFNKVIEFVKNNLTISAKQLLVDAVQQKVKKRKKEYNKQNESYMHMKL